MNIAIVGSRTFNDYKKVKEEFFNIPEVKESTVQSVDSREHSGELITIVSGGAVGADKLGERLADEYGYRKIIHYPDWKQYGKSAGFVRNKLIVQDADIVVAFWKNGSKGTKHTIDIAKNQGKRVYVYLV